MEDTLVYQERAEYAGKKGTLVLTRRLIKFAVISTSGQSNILFSIDIKRATPSRKGLFARRLLVRDDDSSQEHTVSVVAPEIWVNKIVTVKAEHG